MEIISPDYGLQTINFVWISYNYLLNISIGIHRLVERIFVIYVKSQILDHMFSFLYNWHSMLLAMIRVTSRYFSAYCSLLKLPALLTFKTTSMLRIEIAGSINSRVKCSYSSVVSRNAHWLMSDAFIRRLCARTRSETQPLAL